MSDSLNASKPLVSCPPLEGDTGGGFFLNSGKLHPRPSGTPSKGGQFLCLVLVLFLFLCFPSFSQTQKISLNVSNEKVEDVLLNLAVDHDYDIIFTEKYFQGQKVSLNAVNQPVTKILKQLLKKTKVDFKMAGQTIVLSKRKRIYGYLSDKKTGEKLINAAVYHLESNSGNYTNEHGFFSFELPFEAKKITASYIGYQEKEMEVGTADASINIELAPESYLSEVVILSSENSEDYASSFESPAEELLTNKINSYVGTGGVPDIFQYLYKKAGVAAGPDGLGGLHVRGGNTDQNLILLDGVKVYHPSHSFGLYSIFNPTLLQHAKFSKSNFNPRQGGRISSVLDLRLKEGSTKKWGGTAAISNITSVAMIEGPLLKDKTGLLLSFRRSHVDEFLKSYTANRKFSFEEGDDFYNDESGFTNQYFYDFNAKIHHQIDKNNRVFLSGYLGKDGFADVNNDYEFVGNEFFEDEYISDDSTSQRLNWQNQLLALRWNQIWSKNLFSNLTLSYSGFGVKSVFRQSSYSSFWDDFDEFVEDESASVFAVDSGVDDYGIDYDFDLYLGKKHHLTFGSGFHFIKFKPGAVRITDEIVEIDPLDSDFYYIDIVDEFYDNQSDANEVHFYANENYSFSKRLNLNVGTRIGLFHSHSLDSLVSLENDFFLFQPKIALQYKPVSNFSITASAEKIEQPVHIITLSDVGFPTDLWVPSSGRAKPQVADQFNLSFHYNKSDRVDIKVSGYVKNTANLIRDIDELSIPTLNQPLSDVWQEYVVAGTGNSKGLELEMEYQSKRFRGDLAYAYTKTTRNFVDIDSISSFPFRYDQPHSLALNGYLKLTPKIWAYANWQFTSGIPQTLFLDETGNYNPTSANSEDPIEPLSTVNGHRLPNFHRLDAGFLATFKKGNLIHELNVGVQNAYNRRNVWYEVQLEQSLLEPGEDPTKQRTGLPILPVVRYQIEF